MKDVKKTQIFDYKNSVLYLDDLENIIKIFKEVPLDEITIATQDKIFEVDEIALIPRNAIVKEISGRKPYISLGLDPTKDHISLYISETTLVTLGVVEKISLILKNRKRNFYNFFNHSLLSNVFFLLLNILYYPKLIGLKTFAFFGSLYLIYITINIFLFLNKKIKKNIVYLSYSFDQKNFFSRNKDTLIVNILIAIFSSGLTLLITKLFEKK